MGAIFVERARQYLANKIVIVSQYLAQYYTNNMLLFVAMSLQYWAFHFGIIAQYWSIYRSNIAVNSQSIFIQQNCNNQPTSSPISHQ